MSVDDDFVRTLPWLVADAIDPDHDSVSERAERRADALLSDYGSAAIAHRPFPFRLTFDEEGDA